MFCLSTIKRMNAPTLAPIARNRRIKLQGLTSNNTVAYMDEAGSQCVRLHNTVVARRHPGGQIFLDSGGYLTVTTKRRINEALRAWGQDWRVYQHKGEWFVEEVQGAGRGPFEFADGMVLS